jgi:dTDP-4-amino-4,6-dideoxygalactose transaminase
MVRQDFLPFALPTIGEEEITEVVDTLRSGWITTGPKVKIFENDFAEYTGASYALAVSSCTAGLQIALASLGIGPGDEVIVPTFTFCSTANVVVQLGARPVLVDVGPDFNVTAEAIAGAITPRTRAVIPVHYGGRPCDLLGIYDVAHRHGLAVVEDAAHAVGAKYRGYRVGSDGLQKDYPGLRRATVFSFYATKNMTTGEGGMITTSDPELFEHLRVLSLHGMSRDAWRRYTRGGSWYYEVNAAGYKCNMTDIQAALGIHQLARLDEFVEIRRRYAGVYNAGFKDLPEVATPAVRPGEDHVYHLYVIRLALGQLSVNRTDFIEILRARNIGTSVHFIPVHLHPFYRDRFGYRRGDFPVAEAFYEQVVSLPIYPAMSEADVRYVVNNVRNVIEDCRVRA